MNGKEKKERISIEIENYGVELRTIPIKLNSAIREYEGRRLNEVEYPELYDVYAELSDITGLAESTIRSYTNRFNPKYPTLDNFIKILNALKDDRPFKAFMKLGYDLLSTKEVDV